MRPPASHLREREADDLARAGEVGSLGAQRGLQLITQRFREAADCGAGDASALWCGAGRASALRACVHAEVRQAARVACAWRDDLRAWLGRTRCVSRLSARDVRSHPQRPRRALAAAAP